VDKQIDPEVLAFGQQFDDRSSMTAVPWISSPESGPERCSEKRSTQWCRPFVNEHQHRRNDGGRRLVVKNGKLKSGLKRMLDTAFGVHLGRRPIQ